MKKRELAQHAAEMQSARLPGLGIIEPGKRWVFRRESGER